MKCDNCGKLKTDIILCGDDMLCRICEVANERALTRIRDEVAENKNGYQALKGPASETPGLKSVCGCGKSATSTMLTCDICSVIVHPTCANIPDAAVKHLQSLLVHTGWVCQKCRLQSRIMIQNLQSGQARLAEEVAELKATVADLQSAFKLSNSSQQSQPAAKLVEQSVRRAVQTELSDKERRLKNVIVTGLAPSEFVSDDMLFLELCEENLSTKPLIIRDRCRRLGRVIEGKIQPLLVALHSADTVSELLRSAKELRKSSNSVVRSTVFINADMTTAERQLAFEQRVLRRKRAQSSLSAEALPFSPDQSNPSTGHAMPSV